MQQMNYNTMSSNSEVSEEYITMIDRHYQESEKPTIPTDIPVSSASRVLTRPVVR
jgi:hypothetical protein